MAAPAEPHSSLSTPPPRRTASSQSLTDDQDHNTIPDPRMRALSPPEGTGTSTPSHHPDLDHEVAALSTKLINALNHQTTLDDTLAETRQELDSSRDRVRELEALVARQQETLAGDVWIRRRTAEAEKSKLMARVVEEKQLRADVEKDKKKIEQELENLTVSLFEEANKMVITAKEDAKKEQDALHKKNEQLKSQLADTEGLLKFQQDQLAELKLVMEQMTSERDSHTGTAPSSPGFSKFDTKDDDYHISERSSRCESLESFAPTYPTSLAHLIQPVLRNDISSYADFASLVKISKMQPGSRASSGSYSGLNPILSLASSGSQSAPSNASTATLSTVGTPVSANASPQTPNTPASALNAPVALVPLPALKETKFFKRALAEDIEPTLRLDTAPGLSWLARRSVLNAMAEGTLVVEPVPTNTPFASITRPQYYPCSLCGEARKDAIHLRNHRFRTSESESAQRHPLCKYCLGRVRSTCDFLGFLRIVKDGHWRTEDEDEERGAWEESVRLREQMFWSRIGGGVIPAQNGHPHTPEKSARNSREVLRTSIENTNINESHRSSEKPGEGAVAEAQETPQEAGQTAPSPGSNVRDSAQSLEKAQTEEDRDEVTRLSITIPGALGIVE